MQIDYKVNDCPAMEIGCLHYLSIVILIRSPMALMLLFRA